MNILKYKHYEYGLIQKNGNDYIDAFEVLYRRYYAALFRYVRRYIQDSTLCEDIIQDIYLKLWIYRDKGEFNGPVKDYLYKMARNRAIDHIRQQKKEKRTNWEEYKFEFYHGNYHQDSQKEEDVDNELIAAVQKSINKLPERMRLIFKLNRNDGLSQSEIAEVLDLSVKTVETQMGRALKSLREQMTDYRRLYKT